VAFWLGFAGLGLCFWLVPPLVAMIVGAVARDRIYRRAGELKGVGYANWAVNLGAIGLVVGVMGLLIGFGSHPVREIAQRSDCAARLQGLVMQMNVYAGENGGSYPVVAYAPYSEAAELPAGNGEGAEPRAAAGSVTACLWKLVVLGQVAPKGFLCKSDPYAVTPGQGATKEGKIYGDFQAAGQISYSFAYPWRGDGTVGKWWRDTGLADLPVASDMAPLQGTGVPVRDVTVGRVPGNAKTWNSGNHLGDGQNVAFADGHAEFVRRPDVGQKKDNIFTSSAEVSTGPAQFGGVAGSRTRGPVLMAEKEPFDVVMYPVRDLGK
jgi:prepilin-type processing-associated H-X9-DG protein